MPVTQNNLDWLAARLLVETYDINQEYRRRRNTDRLESLYQEAMKFTITEPTFFQGSDRRVGDILDFPTGPVTYKRALNGKMEPVPQYVELPEEIKTPVTEPTAQPAPVSTPLPPVTLTPKTEPKPMANPGSFAASLKAMLDEAKSGVAQARMDGLATVKGAVGKLNDAKTAIGHVSGQMAKTIEDEAASVMSELGQISNDLGGEG